MSRSYISEIKSVRAWKEDALYLYSDAHKDATGVRFYPSHLLEDDIPMEDVMNAVESIYAAAEREAQREWKARVLWETKKWVHAQMVEEARRESNGVVFANPEWVEEYDNDPYWADYNRAIGPEEYYFNKPASNRMRVA